MILHIRLAGITPETYTDELARTALHYAALEIQGLNATVPGLALDPIKSTPAVTDVDGNNDLLTKPMESFLGNCNTPPNAWGDVSVQIDNYRWLELPPGVVPQSFSITLGRPIRQTIDAEGNPVTVEVGMIAGAPVEPTTL